jgi:hypothetical protein
MIPQQEFPDLAIEPSPAEHQGEAADISPPHKEEEATAKSPSKEHVEEDQALQQATRVELEAFDNILTAQIDQREDEDAEEEADVDLYADLYPAVAAEEDTSLRHELAEMKEEEAEERIDPQGEQVKIDFAESSSDEEEEEQADEDNGRKSEENAIKDEDAEPEGNTSTLKTEETPPDAPTANILNLGAEELQELLKDRSKVEDLLAKNPILLEKLKERLKK